MHGEATSSTTRWQRARGATLLLFAVLVLLVGAFFRLQILSGSEYALRSDENRLRAISLPAPRGTIYDRHGRVIADNVPGYVVSVLPGPRDTIAATIDRLAVRLDISEDEKVDLIIMGTRGLSGVEHLLLGSTAERVVQRAACG